MDQKHWIWIRIQNFSPIWIRIQGFVMKFEKKLKIISETKILNFFKYKKIAATEEIFSHMSLYCFLLVYFLLVVVWCTWCPAAPCAGVSLCPPACIALYPCPASARKRGKNPWFSGPKSRFRRVKYTGLEGPKPRLKGQKKRGFDRPRISYFFIRSFFIRSFFII